MALAALLAPKLAEAGVHLSARPLFRGRCLAGAQPAEVVVAVENTNATPVLGTLVLDLDAPPRGIHTARTLTLTVPARSRATARMPSPAPLAGNAHSVRFLDAQGRELALATLGETDGADRVILDATPGARFALASAAGTTTGSLVALPSATMPPFDTWSAGYGGGLVSPFGVPPTSASPRVSICEVERDGATGELSLPRTAVGYGHVALVLVDTTTLTALPDAEVSTLADYVIGGGSVALTIDHPSDLAHPVVAALLGRGVERMTPPPLQQGWRMSTFESFGGYATAPRTPGDALLASRAVWRGGHLTPDALQALWPVGGPWALGGSAGYGFGIVHVLAWTPTRAPALDDPWSAEALRTLADATTQRREMALLRRVPDTTPVPAEVRAYLSARDRLRPSLPRMLFWMVAWSFAAGLTLAVAGRRRAPLLVVLSLAALPVALASGRYATALRKAEGRVRSVRWIDVHAGMSRGAFRRYVGITTPEPSLLGVRGEERTTLVADPQGGTGRVALATTREGSALLGLVTAPWQTLVVREDGFQTLPGTVTLTSNTSVLRIHNQLPWALEDVIVVGSADGPRTFLRISAGATRDVGTGESLPDTLYAMLGSPGFQPLAAWTPEASRELPVNTTTFPSSTGAALARWFHEPGARESAWEAAFATPDISGAATPWLRSDAPTLLARVAWDAPPHDGVALRHDGEETWIRVIGFGGPP